MAHFLVLWGVVVSFHALIVISLVVGCNLIIDYFSIFLSYGFADYNSYFI